MAIEIMIVDDERDICSIISDILDDEGYHYQTAHNSDDFFKKLANGLPDLVLLDIWLDDSTLDGIGILKEFIQKHPHIPVIMMSGHGTIETAVHAIKLGAYDFIEKPIQLERLLHIINKASQLYNIRKENEALKTTQKNIQSDEYLIGQSPTITKLRQSIMKLAQSKSRVLIEGESGVGKELIARQIHTQSDRANHPFYAIACNDLEHFLQLRSQHKDEMANNTSVNDAATRFIQIFGTAHRGTIFLDEVADLSPDAQHKLLRFLSTGKISHNGQYLTKVGLDVRIICGTQRNLNELVESGQFRSDLFYRINVVTLHVPTLADRRKDIDLLFDYFMTRFTHKTGRPSKKLSADAMTLMKSYHWPGNVRQLKNVIEWLYIMHDDEMTQIRAHMLPPEIIQNQIIAGAFSQEELMSLPLKEAREVFEKQYLTAQLYRFDNNVSRTAEFIGMERSALHRKLKSLNVGEDSPNKDATETNNARGAHNNASPIPLNQKKKAS